MNGPIYIVSDNHFSMNNNNSEKERREKLFKVFEKIKSEFVSKYNNTSSLILGGDFFDYWFEYNNVIPTGYSSLLESLKNLTEMGIDVHFVVGNHDYWDFGYLHKTTGMKVHKTDLEFVYNNQKILLTHGDGLLRKDYGYKLLKLIIRHPVFIKLFKILPPNWTCSLAKKISKSSSKYNHHDKYVDTIKKDINSFAENKWTEGFDSILVGHYHQTGIINNKNNNKIIYLGDWLSKFTVTMINENKYWQGDWKEFLDF